MKLVVENSMKTTLSGTLQEYGTIEMYFRQIDTEYYYNSEVIFKNFYGRGDVHLLNFLDIGSIVVDNSGLQSLDNLDVKNTRNCYYVDQDQARVRTTCTKEDLFYSIR